MHHSLTILIVFITFSVPFYVIVNYITMCSLSFLCIIDLIPGSHDALCE